MHYTIKGDGKPVILIHGWAMHSGVWADFAEGFTEGYLTVAVDLRGHGKSVSMDGPYNFAKFAEDISSMICKLKLKDVTLIGWSMGVSIILKMFVRSLPFVDSLVLISGNPSLVSRQGYDRGIPGVTVKRLCRQIERDYTRGLQSFYDLLFTSEELDVLQKTSKYSLVVDKNCLPLKNAALESLKCLQTEDLRPSLDNICVPTLIIHGSEDKICNPEASHYMHERIGSAKLFFLEQTGHLPFITRKHEVSGAVKGFLNMRSRN